MSVFPELAIVIVNWNLRDDTLACIDSVLEAGAKPDQIILVDNASEDGSVPAARARFGIALDILETGANLGYAGGNNAGIQRALDRQAEWILLLNNDTVISPNVLSELARAVQKAPKYGILAPLIFYYDAPEKIWFLGHRLLPGTLITHPVGPRKIPLLGLPPIMDVDFLAGCGVMIRREVFERVGLLDENMFMYAEEVDFFWRARLSGYRAACVTTAHMWHKVSLSANRDQPKTRHLRVRNQIWFYRRYARGIQQLLMWLFSLARAMVISITDLFQHQTELLSPLWRGWWKGWYGELPPFKNVVENNRRWS